MFGPAAQPSAFSFSSWCRKSAAPPESSRLGLGLVGFLLSPCFSVTFFLEGQGSLLQRLLGWVGVERERKGGKREGGEKAIGSSVVPLPSTLQVLGSTPGTLNVLFT